MFIGLAVVADQATDTRDPNDFPHCCPSFTGTKHGANVDALMKK